LKPLDLCVDECNKLKPFHITQDTAGDESQAKGSTERPVLVHLRGRKIHGSHASSTNLAPEELDWHRKPRSTPTSSPAFRHPCAGNSDQQSRGGGAILRQQIF
jgi:hypothetical protein